MTRRDYIALANVMARNRPATGYHALGVWEDITRDLVKVLAVDNHRFDSQRFLDACNAEAFV